MKSICYPNFAQKKPILKYTTHLLWQMLRLKLLILLAALAIVDSFAYCSNFDHCFGDFGDG